MFSEAVPSVESPSIKATEPDGKPLVAELTTAVKVTDDPRVAGLAEDDIVIELPAGVTLNEVKLDALLLKLALPP